MSESNNITVLNLGVYKNLLAQVDAIYKHSNELSFKTRARYETTEKGRFQQSAERKTVAKLVFKMNFWK